MKLIVGLGNPGKEYENTRHNIGFMAIDYYLNQKDIIWQSKFKSLYITLNIAGEKVYFLKPQTYMNLSGEAVQEIMHYFKIPLEDLLIIHDDLDLPLGKHRLKINSSAGGHNGIKSIINCLGTNSFARLKIGISNPQNIATKDYVLSRFSEEELKILNTNFPVITNIITDFLTNDISKIMNKYN